MDSAHLMLSSFSNLDCLFFHHPENHTRCTRQTRDFSRSVLPLLTAVMPAKTANTSTRLGGIKTDVIEDRV